MWAFIQDLLGIAPKSEADARVDGVGAASRETAELESRFYQLQQFLDNRRLWPHAHRHADEFNLIDWRYGPRGEILSPLFLGGVKTLQNRDFLRGIGAVVSIIDPERFPRELLAEYVGSRPHLYLPLDDDPDQHIEGYFDQAYQFIKYFQDRNIPVYVHCVAGKSRSATLVIYYLMRKYGISAIKAADIVKQRRQLIRPNDGFLYRLVKYEEMRGRHAPRPPRPQMGHVFDQVQQGREEQRRHEGYDARRAQALEMARVGARVAEW